MAAPKEKKGTPKISDNGAWSSAFEELYNVSEMKLDINPPDFPSGKGLFPEATIEKVNEMARRMQEAAAVAGQRRKLAQGGVVRTTNTNNTKGISPGNPSSVIPGGGLFPRQPIAPSPNTWGITQVAAPNTTFNAPHTHLFVEVSRVFHAPLSGVDENPYYESDDFWDDVDQEATENDYSIVTTKVKAMQMYGMTVVEMGCDTCGEIKFRYAIGDMRKQQP
jgi:hypothetical protein